MEEMSQLLEFYLEIDTTRSETGVALMLKLMQRSLALILMAQQCDAAQNSEGSIQALLELIDLPRRYDDSQAEKTIPNLLKAQLAGHIRWLASVYERVGDNEKAQFYRQKSIE